MLSYCLTVGYSPVITTVSLPAAPPPPPSDPHADFRASVVSKYHAARLAGLDHNPAIREVCRRLKVSGHPWHSFEVVAPEVNAALGRKRGRQPKVVRS